MNVIFMLQDRSFLRHGLFRVTANIVSAGKFCPDVLFVFPGCRQKRVAHFFSIFGIMKPTPGLIAITAILLSCPLLLHGQHTRTLPDRPVLDQLPNKEIQALATDSEGYVWIGTTRGLFRYSGHCFFPYMTEKDGDLSGDRIISLLPDGSGKLWVGTEYGINLINDGKVVLSSERNYNLISAMADFDAEHIFYSGFNTIGLVDKQSGEFSRFKASSMLSEAFKARSAGTGRVILIDRNAQNVYLLDGTLSVRGTFSPGEGITVNDAAAYEEGIYVATRKGLRLLDKDLGGESRLAGPLSDFSGDNVIFLEADGDSLYLGVAGRGIFLFRDGTLSHIGGGDTLSDTAWAISALGHHHLFVSKDGYDFVTYPRTPSKIYSAPFLSRKNQLSKLHRLKNGDVLGVSTGGVVYIDTRSQHCADITPPALKGSQNLFQALPDDRLFFYQDDNLLAYHLEGRKMVPDGRVAAGPGFQGFWADPKEGAVRFRRNGILMEWDGRHAPTAIGEVAEKESLDAFPAEDGETYFTDYRSSVYRFRNGQIEKLALQVPFPLSIDADRRGNVWIGSGSDGLFRYGPEERLTRIEVPDPNVSQVEVDDEDNVWVCMRNIVLRIDGHDGHRTMYKNPNHESTVFSGSANSKTVSGAIFFGGKGFLQEVDPSAGDRGEAVPVSVVAVTINGQSAPQDKDLSRLGHRENSVAFYFTALCYDFYETLTFAYRLDGLEKDWVYTFDDSRILYSNLKPGKYTFRVKVQGPDGEEAVFPFRIRPAWWMTPWAKAMLAALASALISYIIYSIIQRRIAWEKQLFAEQEKKLADMMNREKIDMFTNLSHELRTPLSLIYGPVRELSRNPAVRASEEKNLALIENNTSRLLDITEQIIKFNNPAEADKLRVSRTDLVRVVKDVTDNFSLVAEEASQSLCVDSPESLEGWCDLDKAKKILFNLLTNALRYTPAGGDISVRLRSVPSDHAAELYALQAPYSTEPYAEIQVRDTGPGIAPDKLSSIVERYRRLDPKATDNPREKGFGIGLNYVSYLVKLHKGGFKAANNPEGGALMSVVIPVGEAAYREEIHLPGPVSELPSEVTLPQLPDIPVEKDLAILLVEDDGALRTYLQGILSDTCKVVCAQNGAEAGRIMKIFTPDIIVSDIYMPNKDGFTLCAEVKASPELCHIPVILLTALSSYENQIQGLKASADAFIGKPFDPEYLKLVIRNIIENRKKIQKALLNPGSEEQQRQEPDINPLDKEFIHRLHEILDAHLSEEEFNISSLGKEMGMSRTSFYSKIKALFGESPQNFLTAYRLTKARELLQTRKYTVSEVAWQVGFGSLAGFSKSFKKRFGTSPSAARGDSGQIK